MDWLEDAYRRHRAEVVAAAFAVLRDRDLAEDVTQEVFLRLGRDRRFDASRGALGPYLRLAARSRALDVYRARHAADRTRERWTRRETGGPAVAEPAAAKAERHHQQDVVRAAVRTLPAAQREAIALAYWGDLTTADIAERTDAPIGTVKSRVRLGLLRLRGELEVLAPEPAPAG